MSARQEAVRQFFAELQDSTGKSVEQWKAEIVKNGPAKYRDRVNWLRERHKLGYRPAAFLALQVGAEVVDYTDESSLIDAMYAGPKAALRPLYEQLLEAGKELGPDVTDLICKSFVSLRRKSVFLQIKPATATRIDLGLALPKVKAHPRLIETGGLEKGDRITYRIAISSPEEIDGWVLGEMKKAYDLTPSKK